MRLDLSLILENELFVNFQIKTIRLSRGVRQIVCSGVFFHAEFMGQAIGEDLRQLRRKEPTGTSLAMALRLSSDQKPAPPRSPSFLRRIAT